MPNIARDILTSSDQAIRASELFLMGMWDGFATDDSGRVSLIKAIDLLRDAFDTIKHDIDDPAGIGDLLTAAGDSQRFAPGSLSGRENETEKS
jgi:hypothetical protein